MQFPDEEELAKNDDGIPWGDVFIVLVVLVLIGLVSRSYLRMLFPVRGLSFAHKGHA